MDRILRYDHYKVLGIPRDADLWTIKHAYREKAKTVHPDRNASPRAAEVFRAVVDAYEVLNDPERRADYDRKLRHYHTAAPSASPPKYERAWRSSRAGSPVVHDKLYVPRWTFYGLHVTGLLFGLALVLGVLFKIVFLGWPYAMAVFCAPGLILIPDSYEGLRMRLPAGTTK